MNSLITLRGHLESLWSLFDAELDELKLTDWSRPFGREWVLADLPYHLAYFDQEVIAESIQRGQFVPADQQPMMHTHREFNEWNAQHLAKRQRLSPAQILAAMQAGREAIRQAVIGMSEADLEQPVWFKLTGVAGWRTVRFALEFCRQHTWLHLIQLRLRLNRYSPPIDRTISHGAINGIVKSLQPLLNHSLAQRTQLTVKLDFDEVGTWLIIIGGGTCCIQENGLAQTDLTLRQSPATFIEVLSAIHHPLTAILLGRVRVKGWLHLPTFLRLFPRPTLDQLLVPVS